MLADSQRGEQHHQQDGKEVLYDQNTEYYTGKLLVSNAHIIESLENDRGG